MNFFHIFVRQRSLLVLPAFVAVSLFLFSVSGAISAQELKLDPKKVTGPDACGECHKNTITAWKSSKHSTTFKKLPRSKDAKKIAKAMGLRRIKAASDCLSCHFTSGIPKKKVKPIAGITCESCHGAGADYIKTHSDYGGKGVTKENETPEHKKERYAKSMAAGLIRPSKLYEVANNCYGCHTVPNEKLVNVGGHAAGSAFELVSWSQGEVRHNVWYSKSNDEASAARKRMMYIVGKSLDLEHALRGVGKATAKAAYADSMEKRANGARSALEKVAESVKAPELAAIIAAAKGAKLKLNNAAELNAAAGKVGEAARKFADNYDGGDFGSIDSLIPGSDKFKDKVK